MGISLLEFARTRTTPLYLIYELQGIVGVCEYIHILCPDRRTPYIPGDTKYLIHDKKFDTLKDYLYYLLANDEICPFTEEDKVYLRMYAG